MVMVIIALICLFDIIARTYITAEGIRYEMHNGSTKWIMRRKEKPSQWQK